jgi:hypothetical protein
MRALALAACVLVLGAIAPPLASYALPIADGPSIDWRDLHFTLPNASWRRVAEAAGSTNASKRIAFAHDEPLHGERLVITPLEATALLTPTEIAGQYFAAQRKVAPDDGTLSIVQNGTHAIAGVDYPWLALRFTPNAGPPITDQQLVTVFPSDFSDRQRFVAIELIDSHSATVPAIGSDELESLVNSLTFRRLGDVLLSDDFSDPSASVFNNPRSDHFDITYVDGEFSMARSDPDWTGVTTWYVPGTFVDAAIGVDIHLANVDDGAAIFSLYCRRSATAGSYRGMVDLFRSAIRIERTRPNQSSDVLLAWTRLDAAFQVGNANRAELACRGSQIDLLLNGQRVASVHNSDLGEGSLGIGASVFNNHLDSLPDFRYANLAVTQR